MEEEETLFPAAERLLGAERLERLGEPMTARKAGLAPKAARSVSAATERPAARC